MINLSLVDDHEIFLKGLEKVLLGKKGILIQSIHLNGKDLLRALPALKIDLLVLDIQLPDMEPEELLRAIRELRPDLPILYLTMIRGNRQLHKLQKIGIQGYVLKDIIIDELIMAIEQVAKGETFFGNINGTSEAVNLNTATVPENKLKSLLSPREYDIVKLVCGEYSSSEIAEKLFLSTGTVDTHRRNILVKLGVNNTVGMVKFALQNDVFDA